MQLASPNIKYKDSYLLALEEAKDDAGDTQLNKPDEGESFEGFVQRMINYSQGIDLPKGYAADSIFWLIDDGEFIGRVSIRHELTPFLLQVGGHIGYYIRHSKRNQGYGKKILELALVEAKKLGLKKALLTCDDTNFGSRKIIEANGGVLENIVRREKPLTDKRRYWIQI